MLESREPQSKGLNSGEFLELATLQGKALNDAITKILEKRGEKIDLPMKEREEIDILIATLKEQVVFFEQALIKYDEFVDYKNLPADEKKEHDVIKEQHFFKTMRMILSKLGEVYLRESEKKSALVV